MASGPITSWQIDGQTVETVADFILGGSKITADGEAPVDTEPATRRVCTALTPAEPRSTEELMLLNCDVGEDS